MRARGQLWPSGKLIPRQGPAQEPSNPQQGPTSSQANTPGPQETKLQFLLWRRQKRTGDQDSQRKSKKSAKATPGPAGLTLHHPFRKHGVRGPSGQPHTCLQRGQPKPSIFISCCCCNKNHHRLSDKTTQTYYLTVLEARSLKGKVSAELHSSTRS